MTGLVLTSKEYGTKLDISKPNKQIKNCEEMAVF